LNLAQIKKLVAVWQERLNLPDWKVTVSWYKPAPDEEPDYAYCNPQSHYKEATIQFLPRSYYSEADLADPLLDFEILVFHELLHIHFAVFGTEKGSPLEKAEENIAHTLARLVIAIHRQDESLIGRKLSRRASLKPRPRTTSAKKSKVSKAEASGKTGGQEDAGRAAEAALQRSAG
jgi:hypothetical protein